ncbi:hypothetical protein Tco_1567770, partial [Tanacetum coccineum]
MIILRLSQSIVYRLLREFRESRDIGLLTKRIAELERDNRRLRGT